MPVVLPPAVMEIPSIIVCSFAETSAPVPPLFIATAVMSMSVVPTRTQEKVKLFTASIGKRTIEFAPIPVPAVSWDTKSVSPVALFRFHVMTAVPVPLFVM